MAPLRVGAGESAPPGEPLVYVVRRGDTLDGIARSFGLRDYRDLLADNPIDDPDRIEPGQRLVVPRPATGPGLAPPRAGAARRPALPFPEPVFARLPVARLPAEYRNAYGLLAVMAADPGLLAGVRDALGLPRPAGARAPEAVGGKALFALAAAARRLGWPLDDEGLATLRLAAGEPPGPGVTPLVAQILGRRILERGAAWREELDAADAALFAHEPAGASAGTARDSGAAARGMSGVAASWAMAGADADRVLSMREAFELAARDTGLPPWLLAAVASRESRARPDVHGDGGHAHGMMQVNDRFHRLARDPRGRHAPDVDIAQGARILAEALRQLRVAHPAWAEVDLLRAAVAAYNVGPGGVRDRAHPDAATTGGDYGEDVLARADWLRMIWPARVAAASPLVAVF